MPRKRPVYLLGAVAGIIVLAVLIGLAPDIAEWYRTWRMTPEELLEQTAWTSPQAIDEEGALISYSSILVSLRLAGKEDASSGFSEETLEFHRQRPFSRDGSACACMTSILTKLFGWFDIVTARWNRPSE